MWAQVTIKEKSHRVSFDTKQWLHADEDIA
jgi:hypothetical protein